MYGVTSPISELEIIVIDMFESYNDVLTMNDLQDALRIGRSKAYELVKKGKLYSFKIGNAIRIPKKSVIDYVMGNCYNNFVDGCACTAKEVVM